jgi:hypothetical protein
MCGLTTVAMLPALVAPAVACSLIMISKIFISMCTYVLTVGVAK